jgi:hypothetical protein
LSAVIGWNHSCDITCRISSTIEPDQTARMRRPVWIHAGRNPIMLVLSWRGSYLFDNMKSIYFQSYLSAVIGWNHSCDITCRISSTIKSYICCWFPRFCYVPVDFLGSSRTGKKFLLSSLCLKIIFLFSQF